jgi:hypothetical protein
MANETEGRNAMFEVPDHHGAVFGATYNLAQKGVESRAVHSGLVALERSLESRVGKSELTQLDFPLNLALLTL